MNSRLAWAAVGLLAANAIGATNQLSDAETEGRELARRIRELRPSENSTNTGVLKIFVRGRKLETVRARVETFVTATNWQTAYFAYHDGTNKNQVVAYPAAVLIIHRDQQPNEYRVWPISRPATETNEFVILTAAEIMTPFAGSDFWLADLGLEFFHWPAQKVLPKTTNLKRGREYTLLESTHPRPVTNGYARVQSWIDKETGGILGAEAYDASGNLLKEFKPKDFKKVDGQWQVGELEIYNERTDSKTRLEFDLEEHVSK